MVGVGSILVRFNPTNERLEANGQRLGCQNMRLQRKFSKFLKWHFKNHRLYVIANKVKKVLKQNKSLDRRVISLEPEGPSHGNVLLSYLAVPFLLKPGQDVRHDHTRYWESLQIAKTFLELGYHVDVIQWNNSTFMPLKDYAFFIDARTNLERVGHLLNKDCFKIMHIDTAHWLFHMTAQHQRLLALQQRKGITLSLRKTVDPNEGIEQADCATILGNEFTISTYRYANKPIYRVPISTTILYDWPVAKNFEACRKRFLWFGSGGMVHKGLDLVIEAFAEMPEYHLTICGPIHRERDFERAFHRELYQTPNIHTIGWVDISRPDFLEITNGCIGLIYPSCSEGQSGGVVTCLHAGLIPIISYESGVDVDDFGFLLKDCSVETIKESIRMVASLSTQELRERARQAWEFARANHTREKFADEYRKIVTGIISSRSSRVAPRMAVRPPTPDGR
jgi:glycosyltransferase involved in cell wall biosynthesis